MPTESDPLALPSEDKKADPIDAVVDHWFRQTFHGSALGRELSSDSHNRMFDRVAELKELLRKAVG